MKYRIAFAAAGACLLLSTSSSFAASRVWISEFVGLGPAGYAGYTWAVPAQIAALPANVLQSTLDISSGTAKTSAAFNSATRYIRIICEVQCAVNGGGTATTSSTLLPGLSAEYFGVQPGATISVIAAP